MVSTTRTVRVSLAALAVGALTLSNASASLAQSGTDLRCGAPIDRRR
jgi:hypothetical protein